MQIDGRKLSHEQLEHLRKTACRRVREGERPSEVMRSMGLCRTSIYPWLKIERQRGEAGLLSRRAKGREPYLGIRKQRTLRKWILSKDPRDFNFAEALWSQKIIAELILRKFKIKMTPFGVGKLLHRLNLTPQKPLRRAYERDPQRIEEWKNEKLPQIIKRAAGQG